MSTVFDVPCPECGGHLSVACGGELRCPPCGRTYHAHMGHLFPAGEPAVPVVLPDEPLRGGAAGRPKAATQ